MPYLSTLAGLDARADQEQAETLLDEARLEPGDAVGRHPKIAPKGEAGADLHLARPILGSSRKRGGEPVDVLHVVVDVATRSTIRSTSGQALW